MSAATFDIFVPGRELELVAGDARADDLADDRRLDAEVGERLDERVGDLAARLGRRGVPFVPELRRRLRSGSL